MWTRLRDLCPQVAPFFARSLSRARCRAASCLNPLLPRLSLLLWCAILYVTPSLSLILSPPPTLTAPQADLWRR